MESYDFRADCLGPQGLGPHSGVRFRTVLFGNRRAEPVMVKFVNRRNGASTISC